MGSRSVSLAFILAVLTGCFGEPNYGTISSMEASKVCMDGGGILDLGTGECVCPAGMPWDGSICEGATPSAPVALDSLSRDDKTPNDAVPEEHRAMYDTLPKDVKTSESPADDPKLMGPPRPTAASDATSVKTSVKTSTGVATSIDSAKSLATSITASTAVATSVKTSVKTSTGVATSVSPSQALTTSSGTSTGVATSVHTSKTVAASVNTSTAVATSPQTGVKASDSPVRDQALVDACKAAKGRWKSGEGLCQCPKGRALVGRRCQRFHGSLTAVECVAAIHPGKWRKNQCVCPSGQAFALARGGCSKEVTKKSTQLDKGSQSACEQRRNNGRWNSKDQRCQCPSGRIWNKGQCQAQGNMTSRQVCISDENGGTWDSTRKTCLCPTGTLWLDQRCQSSKSVSERAACESETNRGQWIASSRSCQCPGEKTWNHKTKSCG